MLLAIDIGNTDIVLGLFSGKTLKHTFRIATQLQKTADEYGILLNALLSSKKTPIPRMNGVIIASVVPVLTPVFEQVSRTCFGISPLLVTASLATGVTLAYPRPEEVGADRIVNAAAAVHLFGHEGSPMMIIDFGTATTFDLVSAQGVYFGGAIAPGLTISSAALSARTAKLPVIDLVIPKSVIGQDTVSSMQSGILFGHVGLVHEMVCRMIQELPSRLPQNAASPGLKVIATGGWAPMIAPLCQNISVIRQTLTLEGLMIIYQRNRFRGKNPKS